MKKAFYVGSFIIVAAALVAAYIVGMNHGHTGQGLTIVKEAIAAQEKSPASPTKA